MNPSATGADPGDEYLAAIVDQAILPAVGLGIEPADTNGHQGAPVKPSLVAVNRSERGRDARSRGTLDG
jgi:hypothetical protein